VRKLGLSNSSIYSKSIIQNDTVIEGCGIGRINVTEESTGIRLINVTLIEALFANCENVRYCRIWF